MLDLYTVHACFHSHCNLLCPSDCILAYHTILSMLFSLNIHSICIHVCVNVHRIMYIHVLTIALYGETMGWLFMKKGDIL